MELALSILVLAVFGVPAALFILFHRVSALNQRTADLEAAVTRLRVQMLEKDRERRAPEPAPAQPAFAPIMPVASSSAVPPLVTEPSRIGRPRFETEPAIAAAPVVPPPLTPPQPLLPPTLPAPAAAGKSRNWEQFLGAKLFAWVGGLALFMGVAFFIKYSFEHNLVPPWLRIASGFAIGVGLLFSGILLRRREYRTLSQTLVATGVVILYAVSFAARAAYGLIGGPALFGLLLAITIVAFALAIRLEARVVAVLGVLGGFLSPFLMGGRSDSPVALFSYIFFLNAGLLAIAHFRNWRFLIVLGSAASVLTAQAWGLSSLRADNAASTLLLTVLLCAQYLASFYCTRDEDEQVGPSHWGAVTQGLSLFLLSLQFLRVNVLGIEVALAIFVGDVAILALLWGSRAKWLSPAALVGTAILLAAWLNAAGAQGNVYLELGSVVAMCLLNGVLPLWLARARAREAVWPGASSLAAMLVLFLCLNVTRAGDWLFWPVVLVVDLVLLGTAFARKNRWLALVGTVLTVLLSANWLAELDAARSAAGPVVVLGGFGLMFYAAAAFAWRQWNGAGEDAAGLSVLLPAVLPYFLAAFVLVRLPAATTIQIFGFVALMGLILLGSAGWLRKPEITIAALSGTLVVEYGWWVLHGRSGGGVAALACYTVFSLLFTAYPFLARRANADSLIGWRVSAAAWPLHFALVYQTVRLLWPDFAWNGLIPLLFCGPAAWALIEVRRETGASPERRQGLIASYGASLLLFVTLIFPVQFSREWLTLGWALEGAGLFWLYRRAPVRWLVYAGFGLLCVSFARLACNPLVLEYHPRSGVPILNWFLYAYGTVAASLLVAARWAGPDQSILQAKIRPVLSALGTVILFLLLNLEIADYFATGSFVAFEFSGNFGRDMTYSLAWSLFALGLLWIGVARLLKPVRYAGIGLMLVTIVKLFFHDLSQLDPRYRIGAFIGVAVILMAASFLYQRFLADSAREQAGP